MHTSVITFDTRARQRFAHVVREVTYHATDDQAIVIGQLCVAVNDGHVAVRDAHSALVALRLQQRHAA